ncbi:MULTISPECIES: D-2-hydroxyacid dehydrogenase [Neobacillus]|uniref:D-2-hydroxyacid dehydrogenase n=1 Tax=Neobacillus rhizophilus TaxID=2833579 RepID=A0A942UA86_9BACI|nr:MULTISPECIES: D-2-hydroxyacid dehydrogenase [Neobacillus]MBS4214399.1 D-2-hydroxyacid dehydrogenase [Neobacillus rhizophilus]
MKIENILIVSPMYQELRAYIQNAGVQKNFRYIPEDEVIQDNLKWADALVSFNLKSDYDYSHLKWVHSLGAGVDRFLFKNAWDDSVLLTRTICSFGQRIGEYCLSYILRDLQFHEEFRELQLQKKWQQRTPKLLNELKVMVYGTGEIGQAAAKLLSGFGVEVYGVSQSGKEKEYFNDVMTVESHFTLLGEMDVIINTMPLTEQTAGFFNSQVFQKVTNSGFINVGRGASVDEEALLQALEDGQVRYAVLDVFAQEPLPENHPLWKHPGVLITPHISAVTSPEEGAACFLDTLKNLEENKPLNNRVDTKKGY